MCRAEGNAGYLLEGIRRRDDLTKAVDLRNRKCGALTVKPATALNAEKYGVLPIPVPPKPMRFR
ncbi:MAG: hypothetical protein AAB091_05915 [Elusimicrobiota bacterium]